MALTTTEIKRLRADLQRSESSHLWSRRAIAGVSLAGMASMAAVSLFQLGLIRHLPDPPVDGFDSDRVNSSLTAFQFGTPDGAASLASLALNVPLAGLGAADRGRTRPWIPLAAATKAGVEAVVSAWYFYQMPAREKAWCGYCVIGALASFAVFGLAVPEALAAARHARRPIRRARGMS